MSNYKLSNEAKEDLIRIHQYGTRKFGAAHETAEIMAIIGRQDLNKIF